MKVCIDLKGLAFPIRLEQEGRDDFRVVYGKQVDQHLSYGRAASQLGLDIMHALACDGKLDNRAVGEEEDYCDECKVAQHDTCGMNDGCPCCVDTRHKL
jgi:hypothetical protein